MQQVLQYLRIVNIARRSHHRVNHFGSAIDAHVRLHPKIPLVTLAGLVHLRVSFLILVFGRTRCILALAPYIPGFSYTPSPGASDLYFMRGLGTYGSGVHFEPGVGQVFNGFFSTRGRLGRSAFVDVAQIEILKGPQGAIIGKNTSLGAINITSNKPTDEFEASLVGQYNMDASEGFDIEALVSGPITDRVRGRAVINFRDVGGWVKQTPTGDDVQEQEDLTARVILDVDVTDDITAEFMYQRTDFDRKGKARVTAGCLEYAPPAGPPHSIARATGAGFECGGVEDFNGTLDLRAFSTGGAVVNSEEPFQLENDLFGVTIEWEFENFTLTSLSNYFSYEITDQFSGDQGGGERVSIENAEDYSQFYQELRLTSTGDGVLDYTAGVMYFNGAMDFTQVFHAVAGAIGGPMAPAIARNEFAASHTNSIAGFAQFDYHINDQWTFTLGGRVTDEDRTGKRAQKPGPIYDTSITSPQLCGIAGPLSACTMGNDGMTPGAFISDDISKTNVSYNVSLQYAWNDDNIFYFTHATGFKSGGFDLRGAGNPANFVFDEEESTSFEGGGKHTLLDGSLRANWTVFHTTVDDLQTAANDPVIIQQIVASADAETTGVELDLLWAATDALTLNFNGTYMDADYDRFIGSCYLSQVENGTGCMNVGISAGQRSGTQDLAGQQMVLAPDFSMVAGGDYVMSVFDNMELTTTFKWIYIDDHFTSIERDPLGKMDTSHRIDASIVLTGNLEGGHPFSIGLIGRNLTDEFVNNFSNASTLSGVALVGTNIEETRAIALRASVSW